MQIKKLLSPQVVVLIALLLLFDTFAQLEFKISDLDLLMSVFVVRNNNNAYHNQRNSYHLWPM